MFDYLTEAPTLKVRLNYEPETGIFTWLHRVETNRFDKTWNKRFAGKVAGDLKPNGYWYIQLDGKRYLAHRLAWLYVYGVLPESELDHVNRDTADNRIANLRLATRSQQNHNVKKKKNNTSGFTGVDWHPKTKKWRASIYFGRRISLGLFNNIDDAALAYRQASLRYAKEFSVFSNGAATQ